MTKNRFGLTALVIAITGSALGAFTYGCVGGDIDGAPPDASARDSSSPAADSAVPTDPASCGHCIDGLSASCRTKPFCQYNDAGDGKSSSALLLALSNCTCTEQCATECAHTCKGEPETSPDCGNCNATKCGALVQACLADKNPNDPACNDPFGTANDGGTDGGDGGTDSDAGDGG